MENRSIYGELISDDKQLRAPCLPSTRLGKETGKGGVGGCGRRDEERETKQTARRRLKVQSTVKRVES